MKRMSMQKSGLEKACRRARAEFYGHQSTPVVFRARVYEPGLFRLLMRRCRENDEN